jgi:hypothetical protein
VLLLRISRFMPTGAPQNYADTRPGRSPESVNIASVSLVRSYERVFCAGSRPRKLSRFRIHESGKLVAALVLVWLTSHMVLQQGVINMAMPPAAPPSGPQSDPDPDHFPAPDINPQPDQEPPEPDSEPPEH